MIPWWSTEFGGTEISEVTKAIESRCISQGRITREFEERLATTLQVPYVVCTTSGTTALTLALLACGIGKDDEVILPDRTWIATAHAVMLTGATVRLCDVQEDAPIMGNAYPAFGAKTKATMPVNLNGRLAGIPAIAVPHIEDSCQAFPNPPRGLVACYSLSVAKIISTGQGGFCATKDEALYKEMLALRTHDVPNAMIPEVLKWKRFGYNFRFTDIQASIGIAQLYKLWHRLEAIKAIHETYKENGVPVLETPTPLYNEILHPEPERLRAYLLGKGIEARPFYPPLHTAPYLKPPHKTQYFDYEFPNAMKFSKGLILPSGPAQKLEDIQKTCDVLNDFR